MPYFNFKCLSKKKAYRKHLAYVRSIVPKNRLLIWNIKDGWKPLCDFLDKPIPSEKFPHLNKTGDGFLASVFEDVGKEVAHYLEVNLKDQK